MMREFFNSFFVKVVIVFIGLFIPASVFAAGTQITTEGIQFPDGTLQTTKATGIPGPQGPEGPQGPQGPQGPPGTIEGPVSGLEVNVSDSTNGVLAQFNNISNNNGAQIFLKQGAVAWGVGQPLGSTAFAFWSSWSSSYPGTEHMRIDSNGDVGIGTKYPEYKLHVNGDAAGTSWTNLSSRDYKEDICKVDETVHPMMLAKVMDMEITTYKYKKKYGGDGEVRLGFIAEDMPDEVLSKDGKGVDLYGLLAFAVGAIKAQQREIAEQRKENEKLKTELSRIVARLDALQK